MKRAEGKRIDGEDVEIEPAEERAEFHECRRFAQCLRGNRRQPQADAERRIGRDLRLDPRQVRLEARPHLVPALAGMDVGAVGEMDLTGKMIEAHCHPLKAVSPAP